MVLCFVPDCNHYSDRDGCSFIRFPHGDKVKLRKWLKCVRRLDCKPSKSSRICICHFPDRDVSKKPTVYASNPKKRAAKLASPTKKGPSRKKNCNQQPSRGDEGKFERSLHQETNDSAENATGDAGLDQEKATPTLSALTNAENYFLQRENEDLKEQLKNQKPFTLERFKDSDKNILYYTGFPNYELLKIFIELFAEVEVNYKEGWKVQRIVREDQIFMTLIKLRQNFGHFHLGELFKCSITTVSNIIVTWIHVIHAIVFEGLMDHVPSNTKNKATLPSSFSNFMHCRIVLDCTEIYAKVPNNMELQRKLFSGYKHRITLKGLVGIAPNGTLTYASKLYPGSSSDKEIVSHCGLTEQLVAGDLVLADKGFLIQDIMPAGVSVNIPPFLSTPQFNSGEVQHGKTIARARIHVERAINRIKYYRILDLIPVDYFDYASKIWQVCAVLTNFRFPLIKEIEDLYSKLDLNDTNA